METEKIAILILFGSFFGSLIIVARKIPILITLPEERVEGFFEKKAKAFKEKILNFKFFKASFWLLHFEKILKKIRIWSLKVDNFTFRLSQKLKKKKEKTQLLKEDFWEQVKKEIK